MSATEKRNEQYHKKSVAAILVSIAVVLVVGGAVILGWDTVSAQDPAAPPPAAAPPPTPAPAPPTDDYLYVASVVPLPGEVLKNQIVITFDKPIEIVPEADGSKKDPFVVTPELSGEFSTGPNFVAYKSLAVAPDPPQVYTVVIGSNVRSVDGKLLDPKQGAISVANFELVPRNLWVSENKPDRVVVSMAFPVTLDPESAASHIVVVRANGEQAPASVAQGQGANIWNVTIPGALDRSLAIDVLDGLTDSTRAIKLASKKHFTFPKAEALQVKKVDWEVYSVEEQIVRIEFSAAVAPDDLKEKLSILDAQSGAIEHEITSGERQKTHLVALYTNDRRPMMVGIRIKAGLVGEGGGMLPSDYAADLKGRVFDLSVQQTHWYTPWNRMRDGLALTVQLNKNVPIQDLKKHVTITPPIDNMRIEPSYNGFQVYGDWDSGQAYTLQITSGLVDKDGKLLAQPIQQHVKAGKVPGYAGFAREGEYYFPRRTGIALPLESRNVDKATITLYRMFPSNIAVAVSDMENGKGNWRFNDSWCERVGTAEVTPTGRRDRVVETPLALDFLFPQDKRGVFCLTVNATSTGSRDRNEDGEGYGESDEYYNEDHEDSKLVLWTNMGVLTHWQQKELAIFVHDLYSLTPLDAAKVTVYSTKNQVMGSAVTDAGGMARLTPFDPALGEPRVVTVERGDDYTFLTLDAREEDEKAFTEQMPPYDRKGYDAFIYADRDLYRPGETIHAHWLVRTNYGDALAEVPLLVTVVKPNGRNLFTQSTMLSAWGTGGLDITTEKAYPTGKYTVRLAIPGSKKIVGSYQFSLEEFVPNRIKTAVNVSSPIWTAGKDYPVQVNAQHLFGAPAAGRKADVTVILRREPFVNDAWKAFRFENDSDYAPEPIPCGDAMTGEDGNASFTAKYQPPAQASSPMKAVIVGRVFELGGRPVSGRADATVFPSDIALGVSVAKASDGRSLDVFAAAISPGEGPGGVKPAALDKVKVTLERQDWNYYVRRYYSHHESKWTEIYEPVDTREVPLVEGKGSTTFAPPGWGHFRVRVHSEATPQYATTALYCYGDEFRPMDEARPSLIKVTLDKPAYTIGEEALVRIESPFDGKGIVVIQGDDIQQMLPVEVKDKVGEVRVPVTRDQFPNVWVEVTVIHAVKTDQKQVYPFSSFAMANLAVNDPARQLTVALPTLPVEVRPAGDAAFEIQVSDAAGLPAEAEVTLAAVDEGIHGITGYKSPDPYAWLGRVRRPDFRRAHYYDKVAYDFLAPQIGGDALLRDLQKRLPSVEDNWIKPVALWSGTVRTDATGKAVVTMSIPEFTGQLRLDAVATTASSLGACSANTYVRRPCKMSTHLPRFLLPGDSAACRGSLFNNTDAPCKAKVSWTVSGAIRGNNGAQELDVPAHGEGSFEASFVAGPVIGQGEVRWEAVFTDAAGNPIEHLTEVDALGVHAPAAYQSRHEVMVVNPGETREIKNTYFVDDEGTSIELVAGVSPLLRLQKALGYLARYPYGCVEQTTSRSLPMYLLRKNAALLDTAVPKGTQIDNYIQAGIARLFSMQTTAGGLSFWPGQNRPYPYGSVYAFHFLTLVKNGREYPLPEENFEALHQYVRRIAMDASGASEADYYVRAYALYVLTLGGDLDAIQQIQRFDNVELPTHGRFLLAAALTTATQDKERVKLYLTTAPHKPYTIAEQDGTLNSDIRNTAIELIALRQMGADGAVQLEKANKLVDFILTHHHGTTQESSMVITALADYLSGLSGAEGSVNYSITGPDKQDTVTVTDIYKAEHKGPGGVFTVVNNGASALFINVTTSGVPVMPEAETVAEGGLTVGRWYMTSQGVPYAEKVYKQTDSYVVDLAIACNRELRNVVLVDLLPAGFEIENPRLDTSTLPGKISEKGVTASYLDVRDDRLVIAFDQLGPGTHHFFYVVRAVTPGMYQQPAVEAECMYDATVRARTGAGMIQVVK